MSRMSHQTHPVDVDARRWDHIDETDSLIEWIGDAATYNETIAGPSSDYSGGEDWGLLAVSTNRSEVDVSPGDWIIKAPYGALIILPHDTFQAMFIPEDSGPVDPISRTLAALAELDTRNPGDGDAQVSTGLMRHILNGGDTETYDPNVPTGLPSPNVPDATRDKPTPDERRIWMDQTYLISAARYAHGRATYIVSTTCREIRRVWPSLNSNTRDVLIRDLDWDLGVATGEGHYLGMDFDHDEWSRLLVWMRKHIGDGPTALN